MASSQKPKKDAGQATLFGFFQKVSGPPRPANHGTARSSSSNTSAAKKAPIPSSNSSTAPLSPPISGSSRSSSPVASASTSAMRSSPANAAAQNGPFKTPVKPAPGRASTASGSKPDRANPRSADPTPPASSPMAIDVDEDEDAVVITSHRRSATRKRRTYIESGSEGEDGSDYADDGPPSDPETEMSMGSVSPVAQRRKPEAPAKKRARPSTSAASPVASSSKERSTQAAASTSQSRPPLPRASTSAQSLPGDEDAPVKSKAFGFLNDRKDADGNRPGDHDYDPRTLRIPNAAWSDMSAFEKQYFEIKKDNMDTILMFQKGKFYEMFLDDAYTVHRELDLKLADRGRMPMVGVPEASFDTFATKLLALGYKVGRVDQMETAVAKGMRDKKGKASDIVHRELRHVMTSGTMLEGLEDDLANYCIALTETVAQGSDGQEVAHFGICTLDAATSDFRLAAWTDDQARSELETLLRSLRVKEIIHKKGDLSKATTRLIKNCVSYDCRVTMLRDGKEWLSNEATQSELNELFGTNGIPEVIVSMLDKPEAVSALGGMFAYLTQLSLLNDVTSSKNFSPLQDLKTSQGASLKLDANTLSHLCVLQNEDGSDTGTLHKLLNRCVTPCGKRLFKQWLTTPLAQVQAIEERLDAVDDLMGDSDFQDAFGKLRKLPDFERLIPKVHSGKIRPAEFINLLSSLKKLNPIFEDLQGLAKEYRSALIIHVLESVPDVASLAQEIDGSFQIQEDGSFKPLQGVDEDFDQGEAEVEQAEEALEGELRKARKQLGLGSQKKGGCNWKHRGTNEIYQIEVPRQTRVPDDWMETSATANEKGYYTPQVKALVLTLKEARETRLVALKNFHARLFGQFNQQGAVHMKAVRALAELDCLLSLAQTSHAMGEPTCRPTFVEADRALIDFEELRHPCIVGSGLTEFIANDIKMGNDSPEVILLTGGNMAGKSTTARTAATAVILAQLGCRVPAKSATLAPVDRICSRMGANDQIFRNSSTFMVEMQEASRIIKDCTPRSLVIMDELGRGTSTFDGHAIAHAVLHHLVARTRCLAFFLTHYLQLAYDFQGYPRCANKHMEVLVDDEHKDVFFTYRLVEGVAESSYGTNVAGLAGVPKEICDRAGEISQEFAKTTKEHQAQRTTSTMPMSTLSDFAYLFKIGQSGTGPSTVSDQQLVSQMEVIRAQVERVGFGGGGFGPEVHEDGEQDMIMTEGSSQSNGSHSATSKTPTVKRPGSYGGASARSQKRKLLGSIETNETSRSSSRSPSPGPDDAMNKKTLPTPTRGPRKSASASSPSTSQSTASRSSTSEQLILDLGQQIQVTCRECSMSYDRSAPEDVAMHLRHHERLTKGVQWSGKAPWNAGEAVGRGEVAEATLIKALGKSMVAAATKQAGGGGSFDLDAMLSSGGSSTRRMVPFKILRYSLAPRDAVVDKKLDEVAETIDEALGAARLSDEVRKSARIYVAVAVGRVLGAVIAGPVPPGSARRVTATTSLMDLDLQRGDFSEAIFAQATPLSTEEQPPIGVHRIHTLPTLRRCGIAKQLLDTVLDRSVYGLDARALLKQHADKRGNVVAFSQPTEAGAKLAKSWIGGAQNELIVFQE